MILADARGRSWIHVSGCPAADVCCIPCAQTPNPSRVVAILNTLNGPGYPAEGRDPTLDCIPPLRKAGIRLIGYVYTLWGKRSTSVVVRDIKRWKAAYKGLEGIFIDEGVGWVSASGPEP